MTIEVGCDCCTERYDQEDSPRDMFASICPDCQAVLREHRDGILSAAAYREQFLHGQ